MTLGSDNPFPSVKIVETASGSLGTVGAGNQRLAIDPTSHLLYWKDNSGTIKTAVTNVMTTAGDIIYGGASGVQTRLGIGGANTLLHGGASAPAYSAVVPADLDVSADNTTADATTGHHGLLPKLGGGTTNFLRADGTWNAPPGGGGGALVFLEAHTASTSASLDFTTFISATYDTYKIELVDILPATNADILLMRMGTGAGPTFDTGANYGFGMIRYNAAGAAGSGTSTGATSINLTSNVDTMSNDASYNGCSGSLTFFSPGAAAYKKVNGQIGYKSTNWEAVDVTGVYINTTVVTGVQFLFNAGNITSGIIRIYGVTKS